MPYHTVKQGEHISGLTAQYGFSDYKLIWEDPENDSLRAMGRDPHVLFPGDKLFIREKVFKEEPGATGKIHTFEVKEVPLFLRLRVRDIDDSPVQKTPYLLELDTDAEKGRTGDTATGTFHEKISPSAKEGDLELEATRPPLVKDGPEELYDLKFDLKIGHLNPKTTLSGQQARLNNLGYFAGFSYDDTEQLRWAIEEFQCDHMGMKPVKKVPVILPESEDPAARTGVQDAATIDAIESEHGI